MALNFPSIKQGHIPWCPQSIPRSHQSEYFALWDPWEHHDSTVWININFCFQNKSLIKNPFNINSLQKLLAKFHHTQQECAAGNIKHCSCPQLGWSSNGFLRHTLLVTPSCEEQAGSAACQSLPSRYLKQDRSDSLLIESKPTCLGYVSHGMMFREFKLHHSSAIPSGKGGKRGKRHLSLHNFRVEFNGGEHNT